ncbi:zonular occludens toxin domain-containing protein [Termitidicoccus mucosus]|uniref:Zona occludens toxin N-terminal domain-containing protein n=1 Tax=Termitidicoccus mucosus TaxID=1184151 RepID=A0A178IFY1_9BACT|nr:hypothetical protein AW736_21300 [Opitutaceae bacterium TSB47]
MSIHFISGKPGGGKTLYAVSRLIQSLVAGRYVVTNIVLHVERLQCYLHEFHPELNVHVLERVVMLDDEMLGEFWRYRRNDFTLSLDCIKEDKTVDFSSVCEAGVFDVDYYLDEIHIKFNARAWQKTGPQALNYLSQHRKLGDNVYCITQSIANVDKQFRSVAQDFSYIRNYRVEKFRGFTRGNNFERKTYLQPVSGNGDEYVEKETFTLRKSIADCYDTSGGVGMAGGGSADKGKKAKGIPLKWAGAFAIVAVLVGAWFFNYRIFPFLFKKAAQTGPARAALGDLSGTASGGQSGSGGNAALVQPPQGLDERPYTGTVIIDGVEYVYDEGALYPVKFSGPQGVIVEGDVVYKRGLRDNKLDNSINNKSTQRR